MKTALRMLTAAAVVGLGATNAWAQPTDRVAVALTVGASVAEEQTAATVGGTVLVTLTERVAVEGNAIYLDRGSGADAVNIGGSVLLNLASPRLRAVPYVAVGGSVHHATFDLADARFLGNRAIPFAPGTRVCAGPGMGAGAGPMPWWGAGHAECPANLGGYLGVGELPQFYGMRLGTLDVPMNGQWQNRKFTDPALSFGGGLRLNLTERLMVRPDLRALVIFGGGDTHTVGVFVVNLGYRF